MDNCRISWGRVRSVDGAAVVVDRRPLRFLDGVLELGDAEPSIATRLVEGKGFVTEVATGDLVSMHWGWVCERLTARQANSLEHYTRHHLRLASKSI